MTPQEIEQKFLEISDVSCEYMNKTVVITGYRVNEKLGKCFIYFSGSGLPEERRFDDMQQFFRYCKPLAIRKKKVAEQIRSQDEGVHGLDANGNILYDDLDVDIPHAPKYDESEGGQDEEIYEDSLDNQISPYEHKSKK